MRDEERAQVFDAHDELGRAYQRFSREPSEHHRTLLAAAMDRIRRLDVQLLTNMAHQLRHGQEAPMGAPDRRPFWWERD